MKSTKNSVLAWIAVFFLGLGLAATAVAQSSTAGDIAGTLTDPTGAAIPNATVTVVNNANGDTKTLTTSATGAYRFSLLTPGTYKVTASATGFEKSSNIINVSVGVIANDDLKLVIGQGSETIEVSAAPAMVNTENADVTTTFTAEQVQSLPNPGNDLTFVAQTAPGTVMNTGTTAGGYGNFSSFGVSGLSNMFTLDGGYENDPFLNLNNTGASNLTLGNNEVDTVTVVAPAFSSQYGGLGGAQVNEITKSGTNHVHGNLSYFWDGSALNANDFFNKLAEQEEGISNTPTRVNANQWGASLGGPLVHDRLFWFVNTEGIRATTPVQGTVEAPNTLYQNCSLGKDNNPAVLNTLIPYSHYALNDYFGTKTNPTPYPTDVTAATYAALAGPAYSTCPALNVAADLGGAIEYYDANYGGQVATNNGAGVGFLADGLPFGAAPANQQALLSNIYNTYNNSPFRPASGSVQDPNDPTAVSYFAKNGELLTEWLLTARMDYSIGPKDHFYIHYKQDHGIQPTNTDLVSPLFTVQSVQPSYEGQVNETHTFTPNFTNQLVLTGNWYSAAFINSNSVSSVGAVAPYTIEFESGSFGTYAYPLYAFPQGRNVAGYQVIDDVSYNKGRNTIRWGYNIRRDNISDIQGVETTTPVALGTEETFSQGFLDYEYLQRYPVKLRQPVSVYDEGVYVEDTFKLSPKLTMVAGLRIERNSNPTCHTDCFQDLATSVYSLPTGAASASAPYSAAFAGGLIKSGRYRALTGFQKFAPMPRLSFNYQASDKTDIRGGFGMFTDSFPGVVADDILSNPPTNFHGLAYGYLAQGGAAYPVTPGTSAAFGGTTLYAGVAGTYQAGNLITNASNTAFQQGYSTGGSYNSIHALVASAGGSYSAPSFTTAAPNISYPTYEEWNMAIEHRIDRKSTIAVLYVGNHGYHEPVADGSRNLSNSSASSTFFPTVPTAKPVTAFATITNVYSGASSNYNGIVFTGTRRSKNLTINFNYEFSKALDEISNGGFEPYAPDAGDSAAVLNPANLHQNYGLADYNVKHNVTGAFVYELPTLFKGGNAFARNAIGGFEFSGDVFHNSGLPYSVSQSTTSGIPGFANGGVMLQARQLNNNFDHHCGGGSHVIQPVSNVLTTPCNFVNSFAAPTNFAQSSRNSLIGPSYTNVNLGAFKTFGLPIPYMEGAKLKLGAQFFNFFNHTNFQNPSHTRTSNNTTLGGISSTVGAPTSILGSTGGADASPRLLQLHASLEF